MEEDKENNKIEERNYLIILEINAIFVINKVILLKIVDIGIDQETEEIQEVYIYNKFKIIQEEENIHDQVHQVVVIVEDEVMIEIEIIKEEIEIIEDHLIEENSIVDKNVIDLTWLSLLIL